MITLRSAVEERSSHAGPSIPKRLSR